MPRKLKCALLFSDIIEVAYYHVDYTREDGSHAYELEDKLSIRRMSTYQPRMSNELKTWVKTQFGKEFIAKQVMKNTDIIGLNRGR